MVPAAISEPITAPATVPVEGPDLPPDEVVVVAVPWSAPSVPSGGSWMLDPGEGAAGAGVGVAANEYRAQANEGASRQSVMSMLATQGHEGPRSTSVACPRRVQCCGIDPGVLNAAQAGDAHAHGSPGTGADRGPGAACTTCIKGTW
jgi:hypothetical protein